MSVSTMQGGGEIFTRRTLLVGVVAGAIAVYLAAVGIIERFNERPIVTGATMGYTLLGLVGLGSGFIAARTYKAWDRPPSSPQILAAGTVAGTLAGVVPAVVLVAVDSLYRSGINVREIFTSLTPSLLEILSFDLKNSGARVVLLATLGAGLGLLGSSLHLLRPELRRTLLRGFGAVLFVSLAEPILNVILRTRRIANEWLYEGGGLTILGAVITFTLAVALLETWRRNDSRVRSWLDGLSTRRRRGVKFSRAVVGVVILVLLPLIWQNAFLSEVMGTVGVFVLMALGLNIVVGYAGLLDLGYVAFFAVGAYSTAVLTSPAAVGPEWNYWQVLLIVVAIGGFAGLLIGAPVLRLRGDYLAIVTLGFGEIARVLVASPALEGTLGGAQGILRIPAPPFFGVNLKDPNNLYYLILLLVIIASFVSYRLQESRVGRAWAAMREDEQTAEAMGISAITFKLLAFVMGAIFGTLAGSILAFKIGSVFPQSFEILVSIVVLSIVILGGMGSIRGVFLGALVLVGFPNLIRELGEFRLLIYGAVLVAVMVLRPHGLLPTVRRSAELQEEERSQDQWLGQPPG